MVKRWFAALVVAMGVILAGAPPAMAQQQFTFSYTLDNGDVFGGIYNGVLGSDGNTFTITNAVSYSVNGSAFSLASAPDSYDNYAGPPTSTSGNGRPPVVTLDASYLNVADYDGNAGIFLLRNAGYPQFFNDSAIQALYNGGSYYEEFQTGRFSASVAGGAPEPATWAFMILGLGIAGAALRRRQMAGSAPVFATA